MAQHRSGSDVLSGGDGSNVLNGGNGNDVIYGYGPEDRDPLSGSITATLVASGLPPAVFLQSSPADPDLLFVATLPGLIFVIDQSSGSPVVSPAPALALPFETGQQLLGFTFDPEFESNHRVYLDYSAADGTQVVSRFTMLDANTVDPSSEQVLLTIPYQPGAEVDRGGWLGFGPDGALYITTGDGAAPWNADPINGGVSQSPTSLMGKVLRIDVTSEPGAGAAYAIPADNPFANGEGGAPEVWALGLRNPFRASFDDAGNLYIGDPSLVSQEEVNVVSATASAPVNFGWPRYEGTTEFDSSVPLGPGTLTFPALEREAGFGPLQGRATIGGYVYDGPGGAQGLYFFGDFVAPRLFTAKIEDGAASEYTNRYDQLVFTGGDIGTGDLISFSTDALGRLYTTELDGEIHLLTPSAAAGDGADVLDGGNGQDQLFGGAGADRLLGGNGNDQLWGGLGSDNLEGGNGADRLDGGYGADTLRGGNGTDTFILTRAAAASGIDTILDFQGLGRAGGDTLVLQGFSSTATISLVGVEDGTARYRIADDDQTYDVLLAGVGAAQLAASDSNCL
jgi:Ca2+-binding RTX toxin-like protein